MLAEEDPMGLVEIGFPRDEYAPELPYLMRLSKPASSDVREVFLRMFDVELPEDFARRIALRLSEIRVRHGPDRTARSGRRSPVALVQRGAAAGGVWLGA